MGMALKADVSSTCRSMGEDRPVDLVYLSGLTMGDQALETEVLQMFAVQLPEYVEMLLSSTDEKELYTAAHTLKGAARSVGAFDLAEAAETAEKALKVDKDSLTSEAMRVTNFIEALRK